MYRIAGIFEGVKFGESFIFCDWQILIWQISRHVSLSMCTMDENGRFNFGEKIAKFAKINSLQNYLLYGKIDTFT